MAQSKEFVDASHALNDLSHALALLESENASLRGAVDGLCNENAKLRELAGVMAYCMQAERDCDGCKMNGAAGTVTEPAGCDGLLDQLRKLGVIA